MMIPDDIVSIYSVAGHTTSVAVYSPLAGTLGSNAAVDAIADEIEASASSLAASWNGFDPANGWAHSLVCDERVILWIDADDDGAWFIALSFTAFQEGMQNFYLLSSLPSRNPSRRRQLDGVLRDIVAALRHRPASLTAPSVRGSLADVMFAPRITGRQDRT